MKRTRILRPAAIKAAVLALTLGAAAMASAQPRGDRERYRDRFEEDCHFYAQEQSYRYVPSGAGAMGGAARGAVGGAVFGAIVGGSKGAKRGALAGGALGVVATGARNQADRDYAYRRAYDNCMDGYRR
jgi:hypothetical protein